VVDVADYQELRKTLGKCEGDTGFNSEADYDFDGCVSYRDYRIWYDMYQDYGYSQTPPGPVMATGQTRSYREGDDGDLQLGVPCPVPRFIDNGDGTVKDNCTGLIWLKNANCFGRKRWHAAIDASNRLEDGQCGLSDDSIAGDWHLPNIRELLSLVDYGNYRPVLPTGHPFTNVQSSYYWSSTTYAYYASYAWCVCMYYGFVYHSTKDYFDYYVWPVRSGNDW
jgi:hypothetical protein